MTTSLVWIIGQGGFLGSCVRRVLSGYHGEMTLWDTEATRFSWSNAEKLSAEFNYSVEAFAQAVRDRGQPWVVIWCAGTGVMSSPIGALGPEFRAWTQTLDLLGRHLAAPMGELQGSVFFASSAGAIYGQKSGGFSTELTSPEPSSAYGEHKLRMEEALRKWASDFPNISYLIGRISSLYGPGQDLQKAQGIISHISRCLIYRSPVNIYVSLDTRRDYLFAEDCALSIVSSLGRLIAEKPKGVLKIFASEELTTLAHIVGVFFRMVKKRPLIVSSRRVAGTHLASVKLRSDIWRDFNASQKTDLYSGIRSVHAHQLSLFHRGRLPPPR